VREPAYYEFRVRQGRTFDPVLTWKDSAGQPIDLTGWDAKVQVRENVDDDDPLLELTVGSGITLGGGAGTIALLRSATEMAAVEPGRYSYSLAMTSPGGIQDDLLYGSFVVEEEATR
jgi:hypothetical protein